MNNLQFDLTFERYRSGDEDAKLTLIDALTPLLKSSIKKYCPLWQYYEDLYQDGLVIILHCLKDFDNSKGHILNYVKNYLKYYYLDTYKYILKHNNTISLDTEDEDGLKLEDRIEDNINIEREILSIEEKKTLSKAFDNLNKIEKDILILFYFRKMKLEEISQYLGIPKWTIINKKRRSIEKLKEAFYDTRKITNKI